MQNDTDSNSAHATRTISHGATCDVTRSTTNNVTRDASRDPSRDAAIEFFLKLQAVSPTTPASRYFNVTNAIIALNVVVFLAVGLLGGGWLAPSDDGMLVYARYGACNGSATTNGEWWRLVTSMFMHYGIVHIAVNMWALRQVGAFFEKLQGRAIHALTYLACGIAGGFASILWNADHPVWSAGASGAIFGIYGALLGYMLRNRRALPAVVHAPIIKSTLVFAVYNIAFGAVMPGIDLSAHIGGFVCGVIFGALLAQSLEPAARARRKIPSLALAVALLAALVALGVNTTPRYNYSAAEEMELAFVSQSCAARASKLGNDNPAALASLYGGWLDAIKQMRFNPALLTAKKQALLVGMLEKCLQNWRAPGAASVSENNKIMGDFERQMSRLKPARLR